MLGEQVKTSAALVAQIEAVSANLHPVGVVPSGAASEDPTVAGPIIEEPIGSTDKSTLLESPAARRAAEPPKPISFAAKAALRAGASAPRARRNLARCSTDRRQRFLKCRLLVARPCGYLAKGFTQQRPPTPPATLRCDIMPSAPLLATIELPCFPVACWHPSRATADFRKKPHRRVSGTTGSVRAYVIHLRYESRWLEVPLPSASRCIAVCFRFHALGVSWSTCQPGTCKPSGVHRGQ